MEEAAKAFQVILQAFPENESIPVEDTLIEFVKQIENSYAEKFDIVTFIFALRSFFCWPPAEELLRNPHTVERIREGWIEQNDIAYTEWLASMNDDLRPLKWAKWTFQAKMSILKDFICGGQAPLEFAEEEKK
jgi:hypothetical protein